MYLLSLSVMAPHKWHIAVMPVNPLAVPADRLWLFFRAVVWEIVLS
jgi:hypothetical protein